MRTFYSFHKSFFKNDININDCDFQSCFPLHFDIYARVWMRATLTTIAVKVKVISRITEEINSY